MTTKKKALLIFAFIVVIPLWPMLLIIWALDHISKWSVGWKE